MIFISILSQLLFPGQFFFWNYTISSQGSILKNPVGNFIWRSGIIIIALLKFPDVMFISKRLESVSKELMQISKIIGLIASIGFVLVGVFPEELKLLHGISAFVCFFGYFIMINLNLVIICLELRNKNSPNYRYLLKIREKIRFLYILLNIGFYFMVLSSIFKVFSRFFPLWEWFYLFSLMLWFLMFPTFIEQGKETIIFEIKSNVITSKIISKVSQVSLLVLTHFIFSFNL
ncbi:MAG: hypothetical protein ACTSPA_06395 [Promethearchaeota archaeon]